MKVFRTIGFENPICVPWKEDVKELLREGYTGGRVECFKANYFEKVTVYDINSLYPSVMVDTPVPVSDSGWWVNPGEFEPKMVGCLRVTFDQRNHDIPAVLCQKGNGCYEGEGTYFTPELELLKEIDPGATIYVHGGYAFLHTDTVFRKYVERLFRLRVAFPNSSLSLLCKYLLNSLYGKFGQHSIREQIVAVESFEQLFQMVKEAKVKAINDECGIYSLQTKTHCGFEHVGISGIITSTARVRLYRGLLQAGTDLVYCDTDSVHIRGSSVELSCSQDLGGWKKEFTGEGVYCGKKLYGLRNSSGERIRCKGVSVGGSNGSRLTFDDLVSLADGSIESILCEYKSPATPRQVFGGKQPCRFETRKRRIRVTESRR